MASLRIMKTFMKSLALVCIWLLTACGGNSSTASNNSDSVAKLTQAPAGAFSTTIAVAGDGTAMAVWSQGPAPFSLWASRFHPASGWGRPEQIGTGTGHEAWAQLAVNSSGRAVVAWGRMVGMSVTLLAATYNPATGWSEPTVLEGVSLINPDFWVSIDDGGVASVSWQTFAPNDGPNVLVQSKCIGGTWTPPETLASGIRTSTTEQAVSANSSGKSFVIYSQSQPDPADALSHRDNTFVRSFDSAIGWSSPQAIGNYISELDGATYLDQPTTPGHFMQTIYLDEQGKAVALWSEVDYAGGNNQITVNSFEPAAGWGAPVKIFEIPSDYTFTSSLFVSDGSGAKFVSVVAHSYPSMLSDIFVAKFKAGAWSCEKVVDSLPSIAVNPAITVGNDGALLLTWLEVEGHVASLWMKSFHPATGWGPASRVDGCPSGVGDYKTARDASGRILIMWSQGGATSGGVYVRTL